MKYCGTWSKDTSYNQDDVVRSAYGDVNASWLAIQGSQGVLPSDGVYWGLLAVDGKSGSQGSAGVKGPQGSTGLAGVIYTGNYDATRVYSYQQAVSFNGAIYVASDFVSGVVPPASPWLIYPGYHVSTPFKSEDVQLTISTSDDYSSSVVTGKTSLVTTVQECTAGDYGNGLAFISGQYSLTFKGTITVTVPEDWTNDDFLVMTSGASLTKSGSNMWQISSSELNPVSILFYGVSSY